MAGWRRRNVYRDVLDHVDAMDEVSDRAFKWGAVVLLLVYIAVCLASMKELRYWWSGQTVNATVVDREEYAVERYDRDSRTRTTTRYARLTYSFHDDELGTEREETDDLRITPVTDYTNPQIEIQFLPGSAGDSRVPSFFTRNFAVAFFLVNGLLTGLAFWVWRFMKADTWATKPGHR